MFRNLIMIVVLDRKFLMKNNREEIPIILEKEKIPKVTKEKIQMS